MLRQWYSIELPREKADLFGKFLKNRKIKFEPSEAYNLIHFECYVTEAELGIANYWIKKNL